jgi:WD40 repeat protein
VNDSQRFVLEHFDTIKNSPSQIYHSTLPLSPSSSWLHKYYAADLSGEVQVVKGLPAEWGTCSRTVILDGTPQALACWKDTMVVGLRSSDIIILNTITGSQVAVLSGHTRWVRSLTFSSDGASIVSGGDDEALKLWDVQTGGIVKTFHGHTNHIHSVSISADSTMIASGSWDRTIRLWDIQTAECHHIIKQQESVDHVIFSPTDPQHLISASRGAVQQWDIDGHWVGPTHEGPHTGFSSNGTHFISCRRDVATVQNFDSGAVVAKCQAPNDGSNSNPDFIYSCFSPNGRHVAIGAWTTVYVWDITGTDPLLTNTLIGHSSYITSLTFSSPSTLVSTSEDQSIKFWQINCLLTAPVAGDPKPIPPTLAPVSSVSLQAEKGITISSDLDGVVKVWDILTGVCKASFQTPAKDPYWRDAQMIDGKLIFVWLGRGEEIFIWDTKEGELLQKLYVDWGTSGGLRISGDGSKVFLQTKKLIKAWSTQTGEALGEVEVEDDSYVDPFQAGGSRIQVQSKDKSTLVWDFGTLGTSPTLLPNIPSERPHLCLIQGMGLWGNSPPRIEDTVTGNEVFQLSGKYAKPADVRWDGQYLVAGYESGEVLILDFNHLCPK